MALDYIYYHANDLEDKFIVENFDLPESGTFVNVGAGPDGIQGSNTYILERNGWSGLVIDGDPRAYEQMKLNRKKAVLAVVSGDSGETNYYLGGEAPDTSGLKETDANSGEAIRIKPRTLESILKENNIGKIDFLSIDTEGTEIDVWNSFDYKEHTPWLVLVEFITQGIADTSILRMIRECGYRFIARLGPNLLFNKNA